MGRGEYNEVGLGGFINAVFRSGLKGGRRGGEGKGGPEREGEGRGCEGRGKGRGTGRGRGNAQGMSIKKQQILHAGKKYQTSPSSIPSPLTLRAAPHPQPTVPISPTHISHPSIPLSVRACVSVLPTIPHTTTRVFTYWHCPLTSLC